MIPRRLIRTVPSTTAAEVEGFWQRSCDLHHDWDHVTFRDPIDTALFPITAEHWAACANGAQMAGLIRLEALLNLGGFYLDSDLELFRPLDDLAEMGAVGCWEDSRTVPDLFLAAEPGHPAIAACLDLALDRLHGDGRTWRDDGGAWSTGPGVTTTVLPGRDDVTLLDPDAFCAVHWSYKGPHIPNYELRRRTPHARGRHWWRGSWLPDHQRPRQYTSA